jgi:hypothetical protein
MIAFFLRLLLAICQNWGLWHLALSHHLAEYLNNVYARAVVPVYLIHAIDAIPV